MLVVCDIDGTIADIRERAKKAGSRPARKDKRAFQMWLDRLQPVSYLKSDPPIQPVIDAIRALSEASGYDLVYLTGRAEKYRAATRQWMRRVRCPKGKLIMRKNDDWRSAKQYKEEQMRLLVAKYGPEVMVFDDDADGDCTRMYRKHGWLHLRVLL